MVGNTPLRRDENLVMRQSSSFFGGATLVVAPTLIDAHARPFADHTIFKLEERIGDTVAIAVTVGEPHEMRVYGFHDIADGIGVADRQ